jgi:hypothetical protein
MIEYIFYHNEHDIVSLELSTLSTFLDNRIDALLFIGEYMLWWQKNGY